MRTGRRTRAGLAVAGFLGAVALGLVPLAVHAQPGSEADSWDAPEIPAPPRDPTGGPVPEDYVQLEVAEDHLLLTNTSDRPINAWSVKQVVRTNQGHESYRTLGIDAYRAAALPEGQDEVLQPGETITLDKGGKPWLREDLRGPGSGVYYQVGVLAFEGGEAVGDPKIVDRLFERRLDNARQALEAIEAAAAAAAGDAAALEGLPPSYRGRLASHPAGVDPIDALRTDAWRDYRLAVENLRPEDRVDLPRPEEVRP